MGDELGDGSETLPEPDDSQGVDNRAVQDGPPEVDHRPGVRDWATSLNKAHLRRAMGITPDMGSTDQERLSRRRWGEVRRLAGMDFTKTWTDLEHGEREQMVKSISAPFPLILFSQILIESW